MLHTTSLRAFQTSKKPPLRTWKPPLRTGKPTIKVKAAKKTSEEDLPATSKKRMTKSKATHKELSDSVDEGQARGDDDAGDAGSTFESL